MSVVSNTHLFNLRSAGDYYSPLAGISNATHFAFTAKHTPWPNDSMVPDITEETYFTDYQLFDEMIFGKQVQAADSALMIKNIPWITGTIYNVYNSEDTNLENENFYVVSPQNGNYQVFKCLDNNNSSPSTYQPLFTQTYPGDTFYRTNDGYHWFYLYTITGSDYLKFATTSFVPVTPDTMVTANAIPGSLDSLVITNVGSQLNSFTNGHFEEIAVAGNTLLYAISSAGILQLTMAGTANSFTINESVSQLNSNATGTVVFSNSTLLELNNLNGQFLVNTAITGATSNTIATPSSIVSLGVSSNTNFYTGGSIYLSTGTGSGQVRTIENYFVVGTQRRIIIDTPFNPIPDATTHYSIAPKVSITGDGTGAIAIATINAISSTLQSVLVVNPGINYTYANVVVYGNTGISSTYNTSANVVAIISPVGGHGSNTASELNASAVGVSVTFSNTENGTIPATGTYRRIGLVRNPHWRSVTLSYPSSNGIFSIGELVTQNKVISSNLYSLGIPAAQQSYSFYTNAYHTISTTANVSFTVNAYITQATTAAGGVVLSGSGNTFTVRTDTGVFANGYTLLLSTNAAVNALCSNVSNSFSNTMAGLDYSNNLFSFNYAAQTLSVSIGSNTLYATGAGSPYQYTANATSFTTSNTAIGNDNIVTATITTVNTSIGTMFIDNGFTVQGTVTSVNSTAVTLANTTGPFNTLFSIIGASSHANTIPATISGQNTTFDQRTRLTGTYQAGSAAFAPNDFVQQGTPGTNIYAFGYVHSVDNPNTSNYILNLTQVKGIFATSKYVQSTDATKSLLVNSITLPQMVPYQGQVIYAENILPITRNASQSEQFIFILEF